MRKLLIIGTAILLVTALGMGVLLAQKVHGPRIDAEKIRDTVKYLSSDELEGRGTGQKGGDTAADWIAAQFKSYGLKPAGAKGSYFQDVPMVGVKTLCADHLCPGPERRRARSAEKSGRLRHQQREPIAHGRLRRADRLRRLRHRSARVSVGRLQGRRREGQGRCCFSRASRHRRIRNSSPAKRSRTTAAGPTNTKKRRAMGRSRR